MGEGYIWQCEECDGHGSWQLMRCGDVVTTWACHEHLARAAMRLQRAHEHTKLIVTINTKHPLTHAAQAEAHYDEEPQ